MKLIFAYLAALRGIFRKVWRAPDWMEALRSLTPAERFVLLVTVQGILAVIKVNLVL